MSPMSVCSVDAKRRALIRGVDAEGYIGEAMLGPCTMTDSLNSLLL